MKRINNTTPATKASPTWRVAIVASQWHRPLIDLMIADAKKVLRTSGIPEKNIDVFDVPGSFEIPLIGSALAKTERYDALIGFGILLEGETVHASLISHACAQAMMDIQTSYGIPFAFEILHVHTMQQAKERASGKHGKGTEAAQAVLVSLKSLERIRRNA